jgi:tripartite-type tricarboxylate transporter receptor subunit TctC
MRSIGSLLTGALVALGLIAATPTEVRSQEYPSRPIRLIVPFPAGGATDIVARTIATKLQESWKTPVLVENRTGAAGIVGTEIVLKSPADGYTLLMGTNGPHVLNPHLYASLPYDALKDFAGVTQAVQSPYVLVVNPSVPARSVAELIAYAKANPDRLNYASAGQGTGPHLAMELFQMMAGVRMTHVPYRGNADAERDLVAGQVQVMFDNISPALPFIRDNRLRALAIANPARSPIMPELPTVAEAGVPGYAVTGWNGIFVPTGTPLDVIAKLNREIVAILKAPDVSQRLVGLGFDLVAGTPQQFDELVRVEHAKWGKVIRDANIKLPQ